jgi:hypothetical protein
VQGGREDGNRHQTALKWVMQGGREDGNRHQTALKHERWYNELVILKRTLKPNKDMRAHTHTSSCPCFLPGSGSSRVGESGFDAKFCFVLELVPDGGVVGCVGVGLLEPLKQFVG